VDISRARIGRRIAIAIALMSLAFASSSEAASTDFAVVDGDALVRAQGSTDFTPTPRGTQVALGSALRAPEGGSLAMTLSDGVTVSLGAGATASLMGLSWLPAEHPGAKPVRAFQIMLTSGELRFDVPNEAAHPRGIIVMLPGGGSIASWRGSANLATKGDRTAVAVYEGTAIAGGGGQWRPVSAGGAAVFSGSAPPSMRPGIPAAPTWSAATNASFAVVRGPEKQRMSVAWNPVDGAASYRVEVASDSSMAHVMAQSVVEAPALSLMTEPLGSGRYYARVQALTADGIMGLPSAPRSMRIVQATLPSSAMLANDGVVVLPPAGAIALDDPRDVEVGYQNAVEVPYEPVWVPAPETLRLADGVLRVVRLRDAITHVEAPRRLTLVRRDLRAIVELTPKGAKWPEQPVTVTVRAYDPSGRLDATRENLTFDVRVNLDPAPLTWQHVGNVWTAHIAPRVPPGPWAVRVAVTDSVGAPIGAGLLEVEGPRIQGATGPRGKVIEKTEVKVSR
jgi:hypothetical protein